MAQAQAPAKVVKGCLKTCWTLTRFINVGGGQTAPLKHFAFMGRLEKSNKLVFVEHSKGMLCCFF